MEGKLYIDIRNIISAALYYVASKSGRKIISWDDIINYVEILEKKYNIKFKLTYAKNFNSEKYDKYIIPYIKENNIYFILRPLCFNLIYKDIVNKSLLLKEKYNELLDNKSNVEMNKIYEEKVSEEKTINNPKKSISFESLFKLFMFECNRLGINSINKELFWNIIYKIIDTLNYLNINITNVNKLKLFRIIYQTKTSQKYDIKNGNINLYLINKKEYCIEIAKEFNKDTYDLISGIIQHNIIDIKNEKIKRL